MSTFGLKPCSARLLVTLLMLGVCAMGQAAPRPGHKPAIHSAVRTLNTTLPVPDFTAASMAGSARRPVPVDGDHAAAGDVTNETEQAASHAAMGEFPIQWRESREIVGPELVSKIRNFKRDGLPIVPLWEQGKSRVALGLNQHGMPGIYFTHHLGG